MNSKSLLTDARELGIAIAVVLLLSAALTLLAGAVAEITAKRPLPPGPDGKIILAPSAATLTGGLVLYPSNLEEQTDDYTYTHGRAVLKERQTRKARNWVTDADSLTWRFHVRNSANHELRLRYACETSSSENEISITIDDDPALTKSIRPTGGPDQWKSLKIGSVPLEPGTHILTVKVGDPKSSTHFQLERVELTPATPK